MTTMHNLDWAISAPQIIYFVLMAIVILIGTVAIPITKLAGTESALTKKQNTNFAASFILTMLMIGLLFWAGCFSKPGNWMLWVILIFGAMGLLRDALNNGKPSNFTLSGLVHLYKSFFYAAVGMFLAGFFTKSVPLPW